MASSWPARRVSISTIFPPPLRPSPHHRPVPPTPPSNPPVLLGPPVANSPRLSPHRFPLSSTLLSSPFFPYSVWAFWARLCLISPPFSPPPRPPIKSPRELSRAGTSNLSTFNHSPSRPSSQHHRRLRRAAISPPKPSIAAADGAGTVEGMNTAINCPPCTLLLIPAPML